MNRECGPRRPFDVLKEAGEEGDLRKDFGDYHPQYFHLLPGRGGGPPGRGLWLTHWVGAVSSVDQHHPHTPTEPIGFQDVFLK